MSNQSLTIWGVGTARTFRVHWMLHELGIDYDTKRIESRSGETATADYTALNPKQKIPLLVHGDLVLGESFAIIHYLRLSSDALPFDEYQASVTGKAKFDEWVSFILMELDATSLYVIRRHKDLPDIYGEAPAAVDSSIDYFTRMLNSVSSQLAPDQPIWGSHFSELDILMTVSLDWATFVGITLPAHIEAYRNTMGKRPAYSQAFRHNFRDLIPTIRGD